LEGEGDLGLGHGGPDELLHPLLPLGRDPPFPHGPARRGRPRLVRLGGDALLVHPADRDGEPARLTSRAQIIRRAEARRRRRERSTLAGGVCVYQAPLGHEKARLPEEGGYYGGNHPAWIGLRADYGCLASARQLHVSSETACRGSFSRSVAWPFSTRSRWGDASSASRDASSSSWYWSGVG